MATNRTFKGAIKPMGKSGHFNEPQRHAMQAQGLRTGHLANPMPPPLEKLGRYDYEILKGGAKTVTWEGLEKRQNNLYKLQEYHRPMIEEYLDSLGYEIIKTWREDDGWGTGFKIDYFEIKDKRDGTTKIITGCDDNTALYQTYALHGGRGLWKKIPHTKAWYEYESEIKVEE